MTPDFLLCSDLSHEDRTEHPPPPGVSDNRLCALCLNYGDANTNVSHCSSKNTIARTDADF